MKTNTSNNILLLAALLLLAGCGIDSSADEDPPTLVILDPANGEEVSGEVKFTFLVDQRSTVSIEPGEEGPFCIRSEKIMREPGEDSLSCDFTNCAPGWYLLLLSAEDDAGNVGYATVSITVPEAYDGDQEAFLIIEDITAGATVVWDGVYTLGNSIDVEEGATLFVKPGSTVMLGDDQIRVKGSLFANQATFFGGGSGGSVDCAGIEVEGEAFLAGTLVTGSASNGITVHDQALLDVDRSVISSNAGNGIEGAIRSLVGTSVIGNLGNGIEGDVGLIADSLVCENGGDGVDGSVATMTSSSITSNGDWGIEYDIHVAIDSVICLNANGQVGGAVLYTEATVICP